MSSSTSAPIPPTPMWCASQLQARLFDWLRNRRIHPTVSHNAMAGWTRKEEEVGIHIGRW
ncbi:hypothetical protein ACTMU2_11510 [Cupriavidus basilensis]